MRRLLPVAALVVATLALMLTAVPTVGALTPGLPRTCANLHHKQCMRSHLSPAWLVPVPGQPVQ